IALGDPIEPGVESVKYLIHTLRPLTELGRLEHDGTQRRGKCKGDKSRQEYGNCNGDSKLLVQQPNHTGYEANGDEHRCKDEPDGDNRCGNLFHRTTGCLRSAEPILVDMVLYRLDHHNGVVHHDADGQYESQHGQVVDGKAKQVEENKRPDNGYGDGQYGYQGGPPALQEDKYHQRNQDECLNE